MVEDIDTSAEGADEKVVECRIAVVVIVQPHHTQAAINVQCRNAVPAPSVLNRDSWNDVEPGCVVVEGCRVEVEDGLRCIKTERKSKLWGQGVVANVEVGSGLKHPRSSAVGHPFFSSGLHHKIGVVGAVQRQGIDQGLDREVLGQQLSVSISGVSELKEHAVGHGIDPKVDVGGRQPELRQKPGGDVAETREVHLAEEPGAELVGLQTVFTYGMEHHSRGVDDANLQGVGGRPEPESDVGLRFGATPQHGQKTSKKQPDCRVDAGVVPCHEATKFRKNLITPRQPQFFPRGWRRRRC